MDLGIDMNTDIYIIIRNVRIEGIGVGVFVYIIMHSSYNVQHNPIHLKLQSFNFGFSPKCLCIDHMDPFVNYLVEQKREITQGYIFIPGYHK
jgi:hypothetical protein